VLHARLAAFAARQLVEQRLERDARFQPRQRRTEAEVVAEAERQVPLRIAGDIELFRGRAPVPFVAIGRADDRDHVRVGGQSLAGDLDVSGGPPEDELDRPIPSQGFLEPARYQTSIGGHAGEL